MVYQLADVIEPPLIDSLILRLNLFIMKYLDALFFKSANDA